MYIFWISGSFSAGFALVARRPPRFTTRRNPRAWARARDGDRVHLFILYTWTRYLIYLSYAVDDRWWSFIFFIFGTSLHLFTFSFSFPSSSSCTWYIYLPSWCSFVHRYISWSFSSHHHLWMKSMKEIENVGTSCFCRPVDPGSFYLFVHLGTSWSLYIFCWSAFSFHFSAIPLHSTGGHFPAAFFWYSQEVIYLYRRTWANILLTGTGGRMEGGRMEIVAYFLLRARRLILVSTWLHLFVHRLLYIFKIALVTAWSSYQSFICNLSLKIWISQAWSVFIFESVNAR